MTIQTDPLSRLTALAEQRRAKTATLHAAVQRLLARLPEDRSYTVGTRRLERCTYTLYGTCWGHGWEYTRDERDSCDLTESVGAEGYVGGQFDLPYRGPSRSQLLDFARHAAAFVEAGVAHEHVTCAQLDSAVEAVEALP